MTRQVDSEKESQRSRTTQVIVALIAATATILVAYWQFAPRHDQQRESAEKRFTGRVTDRVTEARVRGAKVSLEAQGVPPVLYTDSEGIFSFIVPYTVQDVRIVVAAPGYEPYDRRVDLESVSSIEDIRLNRLGTAASADSREPSERLTNSADERNASEPVSATNSAPRPSSSVSQEVHHLLTKKDYDGAIRALKNIIDKERNNPEANYLLAKVRAIRFVELKYKDPAAIVNQFPRFICEPLDVYLAAAPNGEHSATARKIQEVAKCDFAYLWSDTGLDPLTVMNRRAAESEVARELRTIDWEARH